MDHSEVLGVAPDADLASLKAAYRTKLREFPAHSHPQEFKAVRAAYEALSKPGGQTLDIDFLKPKPLNVEIDPALAKALHQRVMEQLEKSLEELMKLSF